MAEEFRGCTRRSGSQKETDVKCSIAASSLSEVSQKAAKCTDKTDMVFISELLNKQTAAVVKELAFLQLHGSNNVPTVKT